MSNERLSVKETERLLKNVSERKVGDGELSRNFQEWEGICDLMIDLSINFEYQDQLLESVGVADPQAPLLRKTGNAHAN